MSIGQVALQILTLTVMLVGLFSLLFPMIPGLVIIWVPALIYGLITGFDWHRWSSICFYHDPHDYW